MGLSKLLALLLVPAYMLTIAILTPFKINYVFEPGFLLPVTNTLFAGLLPIVVAYIGARVYLVTGSSIVMSMGCGMFAFGLAAISAGWLIGRSSGPNINVTIYNSGALVSASFHILGAFLFLRGSIAPAKPKRGKLKALAAYAVVLGLMVLLSLLAAHEVFPPFFIQGIGPTVLRQEILGVAIILYILSSFFFMYQHLKWKFDFFYWYSLALALLAIGLLAFLVQSAVGSPIGWVGRSANYFGGIFSLIAVLSAGRVARSKSLSLEESIAIFFSDAESSYKSLVEASSDAIISFDHEGRIIGWNASAGNMFGHTREEALGSSFFELVIPETYVVVLKKEIESAIARSDASSLASTIEIQGKRCDGSQFPTEVSLSVRELPTGRVITCNVRDITRRKQDEDSIRRLNETLELRVAQRTAELRESEDRLRSLLEHLPQRIFLKDRNSVYLSCNENYASDLGITPEQIVGKDDFDYHIRERAEAYRADDQVCMTTGMVKDIEETAQYAGQERWVHTIKVPYHDRQGQVIGVLGIFEDITERKRAEEQLGISEEKFSKAFHLNPDAVSITRLADGMIVTVNEGFVRCFGDVEEEVIGKTSLGLNLWVNPKDRERIIERLKAQGRVTNIEANFRSSNGNILSGLISASIIMLDEVPHVISITRDITEQKRAEDATRQTAQRLSLALDAAEAGTWKWDLRTNENFWSDKLWALYGLVPHSVEPSYEAWRQVIHPDDREETERAVQEAASKGAELNVEWRTNLGKAGERCLMSRGRPVCDENGQATGYIGIVMDITDRKREEEALKRQAERLRNLYETAESIMSAIESPESIAQTALKHIRRLLSCHRASIGIFDHKKKEVGVLAVEVGVETVVEVREKLSEEAYGDLEILRQGMMETVEDMSMVTRPPTVIRILMAEGLRSCINVPLMSGKELVGALNIGWENPRVFSTEEMEIASEMASQIAIAIEQARLRKEMERYTDELEERVRERTVQLEAANKELESFSYSVSHDLRAPLRAVHGYTRILLEDYEPHLDAEGKRVCSVISESARTMGKLIDDLLAFSRIGRTDMKPSRVDMATLAKSIFFELTTPEDQERIDFRVGPLPRVWGDATLVRHVWMNLLGNAVKFSSKKDHAMIEVSGEQQGDEIVYSIRDNGAGFDMQYVDKLFGVFQRLHSTKEFEGTGVGLAIVQRIVHRHGGRVWAEGETEKGASFHFTMKKGD